MAKSNYTEADLAAWAQTVSEWRYDGIRLDPTYARLADEAVDTLGGEWGGWRVLPDKIYEAVLRAGEVGYARALQDVAEGQIDGLGNLEDL